MFDFIIIFYVIAIPLTLIFGTIEAIEDYKERKKIKQLKLELDLLTKEHERLYAERGLPAPDINKIELPYLL